MGKWNSHTLLTEMQNGNTEFGKQFDNFLVIHVSQIL